MSLHFKNKGGFGAHIAGVTLTVDAVTQAFEIAKAKLANGLERGAIEEKDLSSLMLEVSARLGNGRIKFPSLGPALVLSVGSTGLKELSTPEVAMAEVQRLKSTHAFYNFIACDRGRPRKKRQRIAGPTLEYRTVSVPSFWSEPLRMAADAGIIPGETFKSWIMKIASAMAKQFEIATCYVRAAKGLNVKLVAVHPQQGTLHFHIGYVKVDENGNRLGLIGRKGPNGGGGRLVTNDLQMWAIAMRRWRALMFEPVPMVVKTRKGDAVVHGWELLEMRLHRCCEKKTADSGRAVDQGLGPTWDMVLNDYLDSEVAKLRVQFPLFGALCDDAERRAREENAKKAKAARDALGIGLREANMGLAEKLAKNEVKTLQAEGKVALFDQLFVQKLSPDIIAKTEDVWWRAVHGVHWEADAVYLSDGFMARISHEIRVRGDVFEPHLGNFKFLGSRLCPECFVDQGGNAEKGPMSLSKEAIEHLTPELIDRAADAWYWAFYDAARPKDAPFLSDALVSKIALELRASNPLFEGLADRFRFFGRHLWPARFGHPPAPTYRSSDHETDRVLSI